MDAFLPPGGITLRDVFDIALVAVLLWAAITGLRRARARLALGGFLVVGLAWLLAVTAELELARAVLEAFALVLVIVFVVVFQDDLRRLFERTGLPLRRRHASQRSSEALDVIVRACDRMASSRTGALIVIPGRESLEAHLEGGIELDARVSEPLLLSIFDSHSPGHDGAVLLAGERIGRFAVHLPLSVSLHEQGEGGTRHAAALGLAERSDATCVVVSEERGTISVAHDGRIEAMGRHDEAAVNLRTRLSELFAASHPQRSLRVRALRRVPEVVIAVVLAVVLWMLFVPGSVTVRAEREATVTITQVPVGWEVERVEPDRLSVLVTGARRDMIGLPTSFEAHVLAPSADLVAGGRRTIPVSTDVVVNAGKVSVTSVTPGSVFVTWRRQPPPAGASNAPDAEESATTEEPAGADDSAGEAPAEGTTD